MDKILKLSFNTTSEKREIVRSNYELYSHDKNNNQFELHIENETLTTETVKVLFKFMKSKSYWETKGTIEDNKVKFKFDTSLITQNELVNCYILLSKDDKEMDAYSFGFDVKLSEYDVKDKLPTKERYFANSVVVDKLDVLTKEVMLAELDKARSMYALKSELSDVVRLSNISDVVRTNAISDVVRRAELESKGYLTEHQSLIDYALRSELPREYDDSEIKQRLINLEGRPTLPSINPDDYVTKNELDTRGYLTQHQDISNLATKQELQEVSNRQVTIDTSNLATKQELEQVRNNQPTVDTSNLATKEELNQLRGSQPNVDNLVTKDELNSKGYLTQHQSLEEYAKKTELPQPYNDTDIKNRLTTLENKPSGSNGGNSSELRGHGFPTDKNVPIGTTYIDEDVTSGALKWIKTKEKWKVIEGDTGWVDVPIRNVQPNTKMQLRRINNLVYVRFFNELAEGLAKFTDLYNADPTTHYLTIFKGVASFGWRPTTTQIQVIFPEITQGGSDYAYNSPQPPQPYIRLKTVGAGLTVDTQLDEFSVTNNNFGVYINSFSYLTDDDWTSNTITIV
nr:MAG TPA: GENERAL CONTROL PROTEIN GCN4, NOR1 BINDING PROTEIN, ALPHA/BETA COILED.6A [Caudoviricetes sp.]